MLRRTAKRRAAAIDDGRWSTVSDLMEPGEHRVENTPCKIVFEATDEIVPDGYLFLTNRAVMACAPDAGVARIELGTITYANAEPNESGNLELGLLADLDGGSQKFVFDLFPSPISVALVNDLLASLKQRPRPAGG